MNKLFFAFLLFLLAFAIAADVCTYFNLLHLRHYILLDSAAHVVPLLIIIAMGSFVHSASIRFVYFLLGLLCTGALFKIMHWPDARVLIATGLIGIPLVYTLFFFRKQQKTALDTTKLTYAVIACAAAALRIFHLPYAAVLQVAAFLFFYVLLVLFILHYYKRSQTLTAE